MAGLMLPEYDMVTKVTIVPRTNGAGGFTLFTPSEERMETGMSAPRASPPERRSSIARRPPLLLSCIHVARAMGSEATFDRGHVVVNRTPSL